MNVELIITFLTMVIPLQIQSQNCTGNEFLKDGLCQLCGNNSKPNSTRTSCPCKPVSPPQPAYYRMPNSRDDYTKQCYSSTGAPRNVKASIITESQITYTWDAPEYVDNDLPTTYHIKFGECTFNYKSKQIDCTGKDRENDLKMKTYTENGLNAYSLYHIIVCAKNQVSPTPTCIPTKEILVNRTKEGVPGAIPDFELKTTSEGDNDIVTFNAPSPMGAENVTVNFQCDDSKKTSARKNITTLTVSERGNTFTIGKICANTVKCIIYAENKVGKGKNTSRVIQLNDDCSPDDDGIDIEKIVVPVVLIPLLIVLLACSYLVWWRRKLKKDEERWKSQIEAANELTASMSQPFVARNIYVDAIEVERTIQRFQDGQWDDEDDPQYFTDADEIFDFEFPKEQLNVMQKLGEGNFAEVFKAEAIDIAGHRGKSNVAVKVLKDSADEKDQQDFSDELEIMKVIKPHENVVRLLGCCTGKGQKCMIVEFLPAGDLLDFLRCSKKHANENNLKSSLNEDDFLMFAYDIACGMAHLGESNIVHRDLACRNVLLNGRKRCKVADMGLARVLNENGVYHREKGAKLPIKWMAPESFIYGQSSVKSDVWSFGIVFWEILTLGMSPYPGKRSIEVGKLLKEKHRMAKPEHCSDKLYEIMKDCWNESFEERPTFVELIERIKELKSADEKYTCFDNFDESVYISFDDEDDDMTIDDIKNSHNKSHINHAIDLNGNGNVRYTSMTKDKN